MPEAYLAGILSREAVDTSSTSPVRAVAQTLAPALQTWGNGYLTAVRASGSFAKGTAIRSSTDIDLFLSLRVDTPGTLKEAYDTLFAQMQQRGYSPRRQNVSIGVRVGSYDVDLVPGKLQNTTSTDHSLWRNRAGTWTKTNIDTHIATVQASGRQPEIRLMKLWRNQKGLDFPSFYLELMVIEGLRNSLKLGVAARFWDALGYVKDRIESARIVDPANGSNAISDDMTQANKQVLHRAAAETLSAKTWAEVVR